MEKELARSFKDKEQLTSELQNEKNIVRSQKTELQKINQQLTDKKALLAIDKLATLERFCLDHQEVAKELSLSGQSPSWSQRLTIMKYLKSPNQLQIFWKKIGNMDTPLDATRIAVLEAAVELFNALNIKKQATIQKVSVGDSYNYNQHDSNKHGGHGAQIAEVYCYGLEITAFEPLFSIVKRT